jgi:tripeptidyl-peptidase-1
MSHTKLLNQMYIGGEFALYGGTSASTPIFAGVINRLNEERLNAGKGPIGFLNPSLYANPSMLNDITNGMHIWLTARILF